RPRNARRTPRCWRARPRVDLSRRVGPQRTRHGRGDGELPRHAGHDSATRGLWSGPAAVHQLGLCHPEASWSLSSSEAKEAEGSTSRLILRQILRYAQEKDLGLTKEILRFAQDLEFGQTKAQIDVGSSGKAENVSS